MAPLHTRPAVVSHQCQRPVCRYREQSAQIEIRLMCGIVGQKLTAICPTDGLEILNQP